MLEPFEGTRAHTREIYISVVKVEKSTYLAVKKSAGWQISCFWQSSHVSQSADR